MAEVWYQGIQEVFAKCWITPPTSVAAVNDLDTEGISTNCDLQPQKLPVPVAIQIGSGVNDTNY